MSIKTKERLFLGFILFLALGCLLGGQIYHRNLFFVVSGQFMFVIVYAIIIKGLAFDIFKNSSICRRTRLILLLNIIVYLTIILIFISLSNWLSVIVFSILMLSNIMAFVSSIKCKIERETTDKIRIFFISFLLILTTTLTILVIYNDVQYYQRIKELLSPLILLDNYKDID